MVWEFGETVGGEVDEGVFPRVFQFACPCGLTHKVVVVSMGVVWSYVLSHDKLGFFK